MSPPSSMHTTPVTSVRATPTPGEVAAAYRWCEQLCRRSRSSFYASFGLLERPRRQAMCALYAFARLTDDLVDGPAPIAQRAEQLQLWRSLLHHRCGAAATRQVSLASLSVLPGCGCAGPCNCDGHWENLPLWMALEDCRRRFAIPLGLLDDLIGGVAMDLQPQSPQTWDEVHRYCYHVASAIGLACTYIWRSAADYSAEQSAVDCGIAFQLTNILRDVAEDARMGRIYLPEQELLAFEIDPEQWLTGQPNGNWRGLIDHTANLARERYERGWSAIDGLTPRSRRMFSLMWRGYRGLLEQLVENKEDLWQGPRVRLSRRKQLSLFTTHYFPPLFARLPHP